MTPKTLIALSIALTIVSSCKAPSTAQTDKLESQNRAMIAAADPRAVKAGLEVINEGGSAIDAAIAVQAVLGLVEPQSSGIAGGAFLMYYDASDKSVTMYDGRETASAAVTPKLFYGDDDKPLPYFHGIVSGRSTGVPGAVAMLALAHEDHGNLPWARGFDSATTLADKGFVVSPRLSQSIAKFAQYGGLNLQQASREYFFQADGKTALEAGFVRTNAPYAKTLRAIADDYKNLYRGEIANAIIEAVQQEPRPGALTLEDFARHTATKRAALCSAYRAYQICGSQPPSSGGVAVASIMGALENFDMKSHGPDTTMGWHYFIESSRMAYADRDLYVADDAFVDVPIAQMLAKDYLKTRAALISDDKAIPTVKAGVFEGYPRARDRTPDSPGTSHMSIVDRAGNVVSMTTTVEGGFGSQRMAAGMYLNNQLTDFSFEPVDASGNPIANAAAPGKRPRSSMAPTIVLGKDGKFVLATGSPGGSSIIAYTAKTLVGMLDWGLSPQAAANLPNVIARNGSVRMEEAGITPAIIFELKAMGHNLKLSQGEISGIHIIRALPDGRYIGAADPRREGVALGLESLEAANRK
ncbi:MAG: gamma-glutamyltransferase [Robiginitomaculum sp.]